MTPYINCFVPWPVVWVWWFGRVVGLVGGWAVGLSGGWVVGCLAGWSGVWLGGRGCRGCWVFDVGWEVGARVRACVCSG